MPTTKPRITITVTQAEYEVLDGLARLQKRSKGAVVAELVEAVVPALTRTLALLQAANEAPAQVRQGLVDTLENMERQIAATSGSAMNEMDRVILAAAERDYEIAKAESALFRAKLAEADKAGTTTPDLVQATANASMRALEAVQKRNQLRRRIEANPHVVTRGSGLPDCDGGHILPSTQGGL